MDRKQIVLRENWKFHLEEPQEVWDSQTAEYPRKEEWAAWYKGFDDSGWRDVTVPHDWSVELPFSQRYSSGTGYLAGGVGWYRLHFSLPESCRDKSVKVVFDGIYRNSQVWCNSYYLGRRPYGYSTFSYDITYAAAFGDTENVLCIKVDHRDIADSRWFTGSGITRKVTLLLEEPVHPADYGVFFWAERVEPIPPRAQILIRHRTEKTKGLSCGAEQDMVRIRSSLLDREGETVLTLEGETTVGGECTLSGTLEGARLWSPEQPYLYTLRTWYTLPGEDRAAYLADETAVGIRQTAFCPEEGFFLNGIETKLKGVCVHHDGGALGAAMEPEVWQRRLAALKECGCNAIRCSHNPHMPELYDLCDQMGFLVMDEAFDEWENAKNKWSTGHNVYPPVHQGYFEEFPQWHEADLRAMVCRDRNHPSVILWSIGNEIDYPNDPYCHPSFASMTGNNDADKPAAERQYDSCKPNALRLVTIAEELERIVREEDASRPVTLAAAFPELSAETGLFRGLDVVGYNYKEHLYERDHERFPDKPILGSENGHDYGAWLAVREHSYISGQFLWTGIDYLGETRGWPCHGSGAGLLTCSGEKKPEFYRRKSFWGREPVLAMATRSLTEGTDGQHFMESHWNYREGEKVLVKVYSNLPKVRLILNGEEIGRLDQYNGDGEYCFQVEYRPGVLSAEGFREPTAFSSETLEAKKLSSTEIYETVRLPYAGTDSEHETLLASSAVCSLITTGPAEKLSCRVWQAPDVLTGKTWAEASEEPGYLYQLELGLEDAAGNPVCWQERQLSVEVEGTGELAGLENGSLTDITPYRVPGRSTFRGRLLAFVRRREPGKIYVRISAEDCNTTVALGG